MESWVKAHGLHSPIRDRTFKAEEEKHDLKLAQYYFEEACAKTLFNLTRSSAPFDPDSPYWVLKNALVLARIAGIPVEKVAEVVSQQEIYSDVHSH